MTPPHKKRCFITPRLKNSFILISFRIPHEFQNELMTSTEVPLYLQILILKYLTAWQCPGTSLDVNEFIVCNYSLEKKCLKENGVNDTQNILFKILSFGKIVHLSAKDSFSDIFDQINAICAFHHEGLEAYRHGCSTSEGR